MKKFTLNWLLPLSVFLISCLESFGQINIGVRAGVNHAKFGPYNVVRFEPRIRSNFALIVSIPLSPVFSLQIEPGFSQRGAKLDVSGEGNLSGVLIRSESFGKISSNNIELPFLFQYKPKFGKFEGIVSIGPELRLNIGDVIVKQTLHNYQNDTLVEDMSFETNLSANDNYNDFDYGLTGGGGIAYPMGNFKIITEARYHLGLGKLYRNGVDTYNRGASLHLGVLFPIW